MSIVRCLINMDQLGSKLPSTPLPVLSVKLAPTDTSLLILQTFLALFAKVKLKEVVTLVEESTKKIPALNERGEPRMLMKRGVGLVPYPPVMPTYSHPISY